MTGRGRARNALLLEVLDLGFDYYVDAANGLDSNDGLTPDTAWQTLSKVNGASFAAGDRIGLTGTFREQLTVPASSLSFDRYGAGAEITAYDLVSTWAAANAPSDVDVQTNNSTALVNWRTSTNFYKQGQAWTTSKAFDLEWVELSLRYTTDEAGKFAWVELCADSSGSPGAILGTSNLVSWHDLTNVVGAKTTFHFSTPVALSNGVKYWIVINADTTIAVGQGNVYGLNSGSLYQTYNGTTWTLRNNLTMYFKTQEATSLSNVWSADRATAATDVYFDGVKGTLQASAAACAAPLDWYYAGGQLYVYSLTDPDSAYVAPGIEANSSRAYTVYATGRNDFSLSNLTLQGGGAGGLGSVYLLTCDTVTLQNLMVARAVEGGIGVYLNDCQSVLLSGCTIEHNASDGIYLFYCPGAITVQNCTLQLNGEGASGDRSELGIWNCPNVLVQNNTFVSINSKWVWEWTGSDIGSGVTALQNTIDHSAGAWPSVLLEAGTYLVHHNRILGNGGGDGGVVWFVSLNTYTIPTIIQFDHNTVTSPVYNILLVANAGVVATSDVVMRNNIITGDRQIKVWAAWAAALAANRIDYNLYGSDTGTLFEWNTVAYNFASWKTNSSQDAYSPTPGDPLFTNPATDDYTLQAGSPAIDAGVVIAGVNDDYQGSAPDIGAYES